MVIFPVYGRFMLLYGRFFSVFQMILCLSGNDESLDYVVDS